MPNRTIEQALREHTGCTHERFHALAALDGVPVIAQLLTLKHQAGVSAITPEELAAEGSVVFHACARGLLALPGHERHPMTISDEEYASFLREEPANA